MNDFLAPSLCWKARSSADYRSTRKAWAIRAALLAAMLFLPRAEMSAQAVGDAAQSSSAANKTNATIAASATSESNATSLIDESQLAGLPLNGRSYSQLATLQAGVSDPSGGSASRGGGSGSLTVAGGRSTSNVFLLDGTNIMNLDNQVPRSAAGVQLGSDAVLQVRVFSAHYGAQYGRGSGGILNSITQSGTPEFHGTFFEFFRNSKLDARNFFDPGPEPTPFKRNQFGFTVTGPIVKDKTFLMGSFEGLRDRLTETNIDFFPDALARQGIITNAAGEVIQTVEVHPEVRPYLELYPLPNAGSLGRGIGENAAPQFLPTNEFFSPSAWTIAFPTETVSLSAILLMTPPAAPPSQLSSSKRPRRAASSI